MVNPNPKFKLDNILGATGENVIPSFGSNPRICKIDYATSLGGLAHGRRKIGTAFNDISNMLGGGSQGKKGKEDDMQGGSILGAILDFAEASQRFQSRAPQGR